MNIDGRTPCAPTGAIGLWGRKRTLLRGGRLDLIDVVIAVYVLNVHLMGVMVLYFGLRGSRRE